MQKEITGFQFIFRSLRYRNYRLFFMGQSISLVGTWMQRIAMPWLVYRITGSSFLLGLVGFASQFPTFVLAPFAGVLTDRWSCHRVLLITQILAMIQALILATLVLTGVINFVHILVVGIMLGCINAFDMPARQAFVVKMVVKKDDIGNAIALNSSMVNIARLLGPSIAGALIASTGEGMCFLLNGISYLFVIVSLLMMKLKENGKNSQDVSVIVGLTEGIKYIFGFAPIKSIILLLALVSLMGMPYAILMPIVAKTVFNGDAHTYGFLMSCAGIGALAGAVYLASRKSVSGLEKIIPLATGIFGIGLIGFSLSSEFWLSSILMTMVGLGMMMEMASSNTVLQTIVDDDKRGRVMSFYTMAFMGAAPFGSFLAGTLASFLSAQTTLMISGLTCVIGAVIFYLKLPEFKIQVRPMYVKLGILSDRTT